MKLVCTKACRAVALPALAALTVLLFAGCAGKSAPPAAQQAEASPAFSASDAVEAPGGSSEAEVENNGGYYVRVGNRVFYRQYGADATPKTAVFGEFTLPWGMTGCESELKALDLSTGKTETLFVESGAGPLWYADGGFYLQEFINGEYTVGWYAADGGSSKQL
ncbi:MAG: hypothetical protein J5449_05495, partial [Oscillospiraceae bacterium]|nr:hypothetical protein [Oscillospiraceae bacterium]